MCPLRVRFVQLTKCIPVRIRLPYHLFEVTNQLPATGIDPQAIFSELVSKSCVDAVNTVFDRGVVTPDFVSGVPSPCQTPEAVLDDLPVGARGRAVAIVSAGVSVDP